MKLEFFPFGFGQFEVHAVVLAYRQGYGPVPFDHEEFQLRRAVLMKFPLGVDCR